jgi:hypothetical protein
MIKQVTTLNAVSAATILTPSFKMKSAFIQNNGTGSCRLSVDGGTITQDDAGTAGTDPTTTTGYRLVAGKELDLSTIWGKNAAFHKPLRAIMESGTTILDIITDDNLST